MTLDDIETRDKRVFVRVDINVPLDPSTHQILDDTRIKAISKTLSELDEARVTLGSHQSRPGKDDFTSLEPHANLLAQYCSQKISFVEDVIGPHAIQKIAKVQPGEILVLDNLRFCAEENIDDKREKLVKTHFVRRLAPLFDFYVDDAFATAHRSQPSIAGLPELLPSAAGRLMEKELDAVSTLLEEPKRPCVYSLGGSKVEDKIPVIENILSRGKADKVLLGGVPAKLFIRARDIKTKINADEIHDFKQFLDRATNLMQKYKDHIEIPLDLAYEDKQGKRIDLPVNSIREDEALDVGSKTLEKYSKIVRGAATTVANGPLGVFERNGFDKGTKELLESMAESNGYTVIGGGHLVGLASIQGIEEKFSHVSTAGGAMLSLLSGQSLPGVDALVRAAMRMRAANPVA
ncbi:MAG: phosphoglycerate kinase [Crenarchaeota archaeon 13_1_40CM_3_52_10]|nr:MAG: phosphoglycerate kinase [Crenarchaeota archaeon 13_1_40CM_3_52_10]